MRQRHMHLPLPHSRRPLRADLFSTILLAGGTLLGACADQPSPSAPAGDPTVASAELSRSRSATRDLPPHPSDDFAKAIPGFGGAFLEKGTLVIYTKNRHAAGGARAAAGQVWRKRGRKHVPIEIREGRHAWDDLKRWKLDIRAALAGEPGTGGDVAGSTIDERRNGVHFDVTSLATRDVLLRVAEHLGVPSGAVTVRVVEPHRLNLDLNDRVRPLQGGTRVLATYTLRNGLAATSHCTYGVSAIRSGVAYMVMNSHCTQESPYYGLGGMPAGAVPVYQGPTATTTNRIGTEDTDPAFTSLSGCPPDATCRRSDAALVRLSTTDYDLGGIAGTQGGPVYWPTLRGSTTIDPAWYVGLSATTYPIVGDTAEKIGRVSGWTAGEVGVGNSGEVGSTCYDWEFRYQGGTRRNVILCSVGVFAGTDEGDSGAPVFWWYGSEYWLFGILFGSTVSGDQFFFAKWSDVNAELGGGLQVVP
jgi:hypothetical protein